MLRRIVLTLVLILMCMATMGYAADSTIVADEPGYIRSHNATYLTGRNAATGNDAYFPGATGWLVGQTLEVDSDYYINRIFLQFTLPAMTTAVACTLWLNGFADGSTTDFIATVVSAPTYPPTGAADDFSHFAGWAASGAYSVSALSNNWNSSSFSSSWNGLVFTTAGLDSIKAYSGATIGVAILSSRDIAATTPTGDEYISFDHTQTPYLTLNYTAGWLGTIMGVTDPSTIFGVAETGTANAMGVE